ncbi:MAG TPA: cellulase family glycosylhydrolase [Paraburkholderia sp.]|uniref:glycoside hydrolase family 5 protein n=1 Tax=Paraburkholderia sp. TaxID=1926495 RepID=UPI002ED15EBA
MHRNLALSVCLSCLISLAGCGGGSGGSASGAPQQQGGGTSGGTAGAAQQVVSVSGLSMTLNDSPWLSKGVAIQAFVRPLAVLQTDPNEAARLNARQNYGSQELAAIQSFHADTIRFQVGQPTLDPASPLYDPNYFGEVVNAIKQARQAGFVVMVMMQDEAISGEPQPHPLPIAETATDWDLFAAQFGNDRGVVFELYNEPNLPETPANWQLWLNGGTVSGQSTPSIGMQALINRLRASGAQNVFVLDGLDLGKTLNGLPAVTDPLNRLVYAVHPYQQGTSDESQWDQQFGTPSTQVPVWVDEWSAPTGLKLGLGSMTSYQVAVDLLNYVRAHSIPLCTGAFDVPRFVVQNIPGWTLTNYDNMTQNTQTDGSGTLVYNDFAANYSRALTLSDGLSH